MLIRRARAYSKQFLFAGRLGLSSLQFTLLQPKIAKKITKPLTFWVQDHSRSGMFIPIKSTLPVFVRISSMSVFICNCFHAKEANSGKITTFWIGCPSLTPSCASFVKRGESGFGLLKVTFNAENFYAGCLGPFPAISAQCSLEMCVAAQHCEEFTKIPCFCGLRSFKVIDVDTLEKLVANA